MIRFGLLAVVSTAAIAMYGDATSTECPTIGVDLGIIDVDIVEGERVLFEGNFLDDYCISQRLSKVPWTAQRNSEASIIQFRMTNESSLLRYVWDMYSGPAPVFTNFTKFVAVAVSQGPPDISTGHQHVLQPESVCDPGFNLDYEHIVQTLVDHDLSLIIVAANDQLKSSWGSWLDSIHVSWPEFHGIQITSVFPDRPENLSDERQEEPVATYEERVMEAVKLEIYKQLKTSSMRDKFPRCSFIPLCPTTQILMVEMFYPAYQSILRISKLGRNPHETRFVDRYCYVNGRIEHGSWIDRDVGWEYKSLRNHSLSRQVLEYSLGMGRFTWRKERAMVINIPAGYTLLPVPGHDFDEGYLDGLPGSTQVDPCAFLFEYSWDHFAYGLWRNSMMVLVLKPGNEAQREILEAVRSKIKPEQMKKRMIISPSQCGDCLDELYEYYRVLFPVSYGTCRAELIP